MKCGRGFATLFYMRRSFSFICISALLSGCTTAGSLLGSGEDAVTLSGSISFVKATTQNIQDAYTITVSTFNAIKVGIERRVDSVQQGVEKIQEGKELIQEGVM